MIDHEILKLMTEQLKKQFPEIEIKTVIEVETGWLMGEFFKAVDSILDDNEKSDTLPEEIYQYYLGLPSKKEYEKEAAKKAAIEEAAEKAAALKKAVAERKLKELEIIENLEKIKDPEDLIELIEPKPPEPPEEPEECPGFGLSYDPFAIECKACRDDFPNEYNECAKICGIEPPPRSPKTIFNHTKNKMNGTVDELLLQGVTYGELIEALYTDFPKNSLGKLKSVIYNHYLHLYIEHGVRIGDVERISAKTPLHTYLKIDNYDGKQ